MSAMDSTKPRLTQMVKKGGCAAKLPAESLRRVLASLKLERPDALLVGTQTLDDGALWRLGNGQLLIQTLDFFTPIVDDLADFGAIAAANALSDVYAMGGTPATALTILGFPAATLDIALLEPLMGGALDRIHASGACLAGGHSIENDALVLGFSVMGFVAEEDAWLNSGARVGDQLILTKGLGTGTLTSALKLDKAKPEWISAAVKSMTQLNHVRDLLAGVEVHAATDVTGFALAGHAMQMAQASQVTLAIEAQRLPVLIGAIETLDEGVLNRAHYTNRDYVRPNSNLDDLDAPWSWLAVDPQTSGGLLLSVPAAQAEHAVAQLNKRFEGARMIGDVREKDSKDLLFL